MYTLVYRIGINDILALQRWFVNGEVECFTGSHIALALLAILVLLTALLLLPLSVLVTTMPWRRVSRLTCL